jgi:hypothetical protein
VGGYVYLQFQVINYRMYLKQLKMEINSEELHVGRDNYF